MAPSSGNLYLIIRCHVKTKVTQQLLYGCGHFAFVFSGSPGLEHPPNPTFYLLVGVLYFLTI